MKQPLSRRAVLFCLIVAAGAVFDVYSKDVVFRDLGLQSARNGQAVSIVPAEHQLFDHPPWREGESMPWIESWTTFRLYTSINRGALWGMGQGLTWLFASLSVVAIGAILYWLFGYGAARSLWLTVALALIMSGTLGNLYDRLALHGYQDVDGQAIHGVRDFLLFTFGQFAWPVFNFADVFLVTGAVMLAVQSLWFPQTELAAPEDKGPSAASRSPAATGTAGPQDAGETTSKSPRPDEAGSDAAHVA